jgi:hypothetical protein
MSCKLSLFLSQNIHAEITSVLDRTTPVTAQTGYGLQNAFFKKKFWEELIAYFP